MAFYNPTWIRRLIKEEATNIIDYVTKDKKKDFRGYVDAKMPFVLWLDISEITSKVLEPNAFLLDAAISSVFLPSEIVWAKDTLRSVLINAYKATINQYIDNPRYREIEYDELSSMLEGLSKLPVGEIRKYLDTYFSKTLRIGGSMSSKNKRVMLISPTFTNIRFGQDFKANIDYSSFGSRDRYTQDPITGDLVETAYSKITEILSDTTGKLTGKKQDFFTQLQNVGHIEIDVVAKDTKEVKRGQVSPRFLQALVSVPNNPAIIEKLQVSFSKETLQHETRVTVRKNFSQGKLVFEMLVENGFPIGIPESQITNLMKATKELSFDIGKGLTAQIRANPSILIDMETSKSIKQYTFENIKNLISSGKGLPNYTSSSSFKEKASTTIPKVKLVNSKYTKATTTVLSNLSKPPAVRTVQGKFYSLASLQLLINSQLQDVISANMGSGDSRNTLHYRTGRFAASASVTKMSQSREGMITAFYTYMKNPYQTFEPGFKQGSPKTRDPKLLIGRSIRDIAATKVANTLRAISV